MFMMKNPAQAQSDRLAKLLGEERLAMVAFLLALVEFDGKRLWVDLGYASLFDYLHRELALSKTTAYFRMSAARLIRAFPEVVEPLRDGRLCITAVAELAKVLTRDNCAAVLPRFYGMASREAKAVTAALAPMEEPPFRDVITRVPLRALEVLSLRAVPEADDSSVRGPDQHRAEVPEPTDNGVPNGTPVGCTAAVLQLAVPALRQDEVLPLTADLRRVHLTVSRAFEEKLTRAKVALSHKYPAGRLEEIFDAGLDLILEEHDRRKGALKKPKPQKTAPARPPAGHDAGSARARSRAENKDIPRPVKREVWRRDSGRCQWKLASGNPCGSQVRVQFDHVVPRSRGGPSTAANVRLLCAAHNIIAARELLGDPLMDRHLRGRPAG
jgi:5-methylcytosine-specific restriction endonuclease McrA